MLRRSVFLLILLVFSLSCAPADRAVTPKKNGAGAEGDLLKRAAIIHSEVLTLDAHADVEIAGAPSAYVGADGLSKVAPAKMRAGGLDAVVMALAVGPKPRSIQGYAQAAEIARNKLAAVRLLAAEPANNLVIVTRADELIDAHSRGQLAVLLGFQNALILGTQVEDLTRWFDAGVRVFALTHMGHNDFADSSRTLYDSISGERELESEHGGLSDLGRQAVAKVNLLGGVLDISQLSKSAALQVIEMSATPVIASHSNVRALTHVSRNLSDEEIDRIGATGGVIHVAPFRGYLFNSADPRMDSDIRAVRRAHGIQEDYLYPFELYWEIDDPQLKQEFLTTMSALLGPIDLQDMLDHVDYIAQRVGADHVGIGTDFNHGSGIAGFEDASDALNVTVGLLERGYTAAEIRKIWGGNFIRVWRAAEARSKKS